MRPLAALVPLLLASLAGCATLEPELTIAFVNGDDEPHEVQQRLIRSGGTRAQTITETVDLTAGETQSWTYLDWPEDRRILRVFVDGVKVYDRLFEDWIKQVDLCLAVDADGVVTEHAAPCPSP